MTKTIKPTNMIFAINRAKKEGRNIMVTFYDDDGKTVHLHFDKDQLNEVRRSITSILSEISKSEGNDGYLID